MLFMHDTCVNGRTIGFCWLLVHELPAMQDCIITVA